MSALSEADHKLLVAIQAGLPLVAEPYRELAGQLGMTEEEVLTRLQAFLDQGVIRRLGAVPNHYALGIRANGMCVWDVPDDEISAVGHRLGAHPEVTHCYQRPRHRPLWPYNLFAMLHGTSREDVRAKAAALVREMGLEKYPHTILFSTRLLKKTGVRLQEARTGND